MPKHNHRTHNTSGCWTATSDILAKEKTGCSRLIWADQNTLLFTLYGTYNLCSLCQKTYHNPVWNANINTICTNTYFWLQLYKLIVFRWVRCAAHKHKHTVSETVDCFSLMSNSIKYQKRLIQQVKHYHYQQHLLPLCNSAGIHGSYKGKKRVCVCMCVDCISGAGSAYRLTNHFVHQGDQVGLHVSVAHDYAVLARRSFLSQTGDAILPKGPTVDLVTAAIFHLLFIFFHLLLSRLPQSFSCSFNFKHSGSQEFSRSTHQVNIHAVYTFFICLLMPFQLSFYSAEKSRKFKLFLLAQRERNLSCWSQLHQLQGNIFMFLSQCLYVFLSLFVSVWICISPPPPISSPSLLFPFFFFSLPISHPFSFSFTPQPSLTV